MTGRDAYEAARNAAAFAEISNYGWLQLRGRDRLDLLHRLSTNHLKELAPGAGATTVLTNASARIIALLTLYAGQDATFVRTMPEQAAPVMRYLQSMIFWQDDVQLEDFTHQRLQVAFFGPQATENLERMTGLELGALSPYAWLPATLGDASVTVHRGGELEPWLWTVTADAGQRREVLNGLARTGPLLDQATADILRIEAGLPRWGAELSDQVTPLETGLLPAVHFNKGCYTGQEVIARQTNYDKVTRNLVGLLFEPGVELEPLASGQQVEVKGPGRGGFVGSLAYSPRLDRTIALAVVPRDLITPGTSVTVVRGDQTYQATVTPLPFTS